MRWITRDKNYYRSLIMLAKGELGPTLARGALARTLHGARV